MLLELLRPGAFDQTPCRHVIKKLSELARASVFIDVILTQQAIAQLLEGPRTLEITPDGRRYAGESEAVASIGVQFVAKFGFHQNDCALIDWTSHSTHSYSTRLADV